MMIEEEVEVKVKVQRIVIAPRMSLKQFAKFCTASLPVRETVLQKSKYPGGYIPRYHEIARKIICAAFSSNFNDDEHDVHFEEFSRHAIRLRKEAQAYDGKTDEHKNRIYSASALEAMSKISGIIIPILKRYVLNSNLHMRKDATSIAGVSVGAVSDLICSTDSGLTIAGFIKFNFTAAALKKEEAEHMLFVLKKFFHAKHKIKTDAKDCMVIDVVDGKIYRGIETSNLAESIQINCEEIRSRWDTIEPPLRKPKDL